MPTLKQLLQTHLTASDYTDLRNNLPAILQQHPRTVRRTLNGKRNPSIEEIVLYSKYLPISTDELIEQITNKRPCTKPLEP